MVIETWLRAENQTSISQRETTSIVQDSFIRATSWFGALTARIYKDLRNKDLPVRGVRNFSLRVDSDTLESIYNSILSDMAGEQAKILSADHIDDILFFAERSRHPLRNRVRRRLADESSSAQSNFHQPFFHQKSEGLTIELPAVIYRHRIAYGEVLAGENIQPTAS